MIRTPRSLYPHRAGFASQRTVAVLLAFASGALVLVAFVLPHLAGEAARERQVIAAPAGPAAELVEPASETTVVLLETAEPPAEAPAEAEAIPVESEALAPSQAAAPVALESEAPAYPQLKYVRGTGKAEQISPRDARHRTKDQASARRKEREEKGLPPLEKREPGSAGASGETIRPRDATRAPAKYPGRGKGRKRGTGGDASGG